MLNIRLKILVLVSLMVTILIGLLSYQRLKVTAITPTPTATPSWQQCAINPLDNVELYPEQQWLDAEQFEAYLAEMHISNLMLPSDWGQPFLAVDWNHENFVADSGRMIALGFANLHHRGGRWGAGKIIYATYDFTVGAEYDTYATVEDYEALQSGKIDEQSIIETENGTQGIVIYKWHIVFESIEKIIVFPFEDHYIAIVYLLEGDYQDNHEAMVEILQEDIYPENEQCLLDMIDIFARNLEFSDQRFAPDETSD